MKELCDDRTEIKFIVDGMLGTLAKWLRLLGYDTIYLQNTSDDVIMKKSSAEKRILLTRDSRLIERRLIKRKTVIGLFVETTTLEDQLLQVIRVFDLKSRAPFCSVCNFPLEHANREIVKGKVPLYVLETQKHFSVCPLCHRYYWAGTHWMGIDKQIKNLKQRSKSTAKTNGTTYD